MKGTPSKQSHPLNEALVNRHKKGQLNQALAEIVHTDLDKLELRSYTTLQIINDLMTQFPNN